MRYCAFYGISAPILLLFTRKQIDCIFEHPFTGPANNLLTDLRFEVLKLRSILKDEGVLKLDIDSNSLVTKRFLAGLNMAMDAKDVPIISAPSASSEEDFTNLFDSITTDIETLSENSGLDVAASDAASVWQMSSSLVRDGMGHEDYTGRFKSIPMVKKFMALDMKRELSLGDADILREQYKQLPQVPNGRAMFDGRSYDLASEYPELYSVLSAIYRTALETVEGVTKIDYILNRIDQVREKSKFATAKFFGVHYDRLKDMRSLYSFNTNINSSIQKGPLDLDDMYSRLQLIDRYLADCNLLLGVNEGSTLKPAELERLMMNYQSKIEFAANLVTLDIFVSAGLGDAEGPLSEVLQLAQDLQLSKDSSMLKHMFGNLQEMVLLTLLYKKLMELDAGDAASAWGIPNDPALINQTGIDLARKLGIGGVYAGYRQSFVEAFAKSNVIARQQFTLEQNMAEEFNEGDGTIRENIEFISRHLTSKKERLVSNAS